MSSDSLAESTGLSRGTVVHHLNKLIESGLVLYDGRNYWLRDSNLELLVDEIRKDAEKTIEDLRRVARELDRMLGM